MNRGSEDDEVSREMWQAVETSTRKIRMGKSEERRSKGRSRKEERGKRQEKEIEKEKDDRGKESGRRMEDLG